MIHEDRRLIRRLSVTAQSQAVLSAMICRCRYYPDAIRLHNRDISDLTIARLIYKRARSPPRYKSRSQPFVYPKNRSVCGTSCT